AIGVISLFGIDHDVGGDDDRLAVEGEAGGAVHSVVVEGDVLCEDEHAGLGSAGGDGERLHERFFSGVVVEGAQADVARVEGAADARVDCQFQPGGFGEDDGVHQVDVAGVAVVADLGGDGAVIVQFDAAGEQD